MPDTQPIYGPASMQAAPPQWPIPMLSTPAPAPSYLTFEGTPEAKAKLMAELAAARLDFGPVFRDRTGQYGGQRFPYATLGSLTEATAGPLAQHGIFVFSCFTSSPVDPNKHRLTTKIMGHGAELTACLDFDPRLGIKENAEEGQRKVEWIKEYGKIQTYLLRYQYRSLFVLDSEPDADDAPIERQDTSQAPRREAPRPDHKGSAGSAVKHAEGQTRAQPQPTPQPVAQPPRLATVATLPPAAPVGAPATKTEADGPPDKDMIDQIRALYSQLNMTPIRFSALCDDTVKMTPDEMKQSARASYTMMCTLQKMVMARQPSQVST